MGTDGAGFTYESLHRIAAHMLELAALDGANPDETRRDALIIAHLALVAGLDRLGGRIAPQVWSDEKAYFTRTPHRGVLGKLNWLCEELGVAPDWGVRPWQSLKTLDSWRNRVAHGTAGETAPRTALDEQGARRTLVDLEAVIRRLCEAAGKDV